MMEDAQTRARKAQVVSLVVSAKCDGVGMRREEGGTNMWGGSRWDEGDEQCC